MQAEMESENSRRNSRSLTLSDGSRAFIKLEPQTWQAIERLAGFDGYDWDDWVRTVLDAAEGRGIVAPAGKLEDFSRAAILRTYVIGGLNRQVEAMSAMQHLHMEDQITIPLSEGVAIVLNEKSARDVAGRINRVLKLKGAKK